MLLSGLAAVLLFPARPRGRTSRPRWPGRDAAGRTRTWLVLVAAAAVGLLVWLDGRRLALALIGLGALAGLMSQVRRGRMRKRADLRRGEVVEVCEALVGELRAGQPVLRGLERCLDVWPPFEPVVAAARLGADVPDALRRVAAEPGAEGLREVASAWRVSQSSGAGLAAALGQVAASCRVREQTRRVVEAELASARATARLVAVLPLAAMAMGAGIGARPWHFLLDTTPGLACLGVGVALVLAGMWWIDAIERAVYAP